MSVPSHKFENIIEVYQPSHGTGIYELIRIFSKKTIYHKFTIIPENKCKPVRVRLLILEKKSLAAIQNTE